MGGAAWVVGGDGRPWGGLARGTERLGVIKHNRGYLAASYGCKRELGSVVWLRDGCRLEYKAFVRVRLSVRRVGIDRDT